jgi:heme/copper-type cytochrome/quinol oxidase subunit 2
MRGGVVVQDEEDYNQWLIEQETFADIIAKQKIQGIDETKLAKK